jgi:hypothetical protein
VATNASAAANTVADGDNQFAIPVKGTGLSVIAAFPAELDFGAEAMSQRSAAQPVTFTNQGFSPVQILPAISTPCGMPGTFVQLPQPLIPGVVSGFQLVQATDGAQTLQVTPGDISYECDLDPGNEQSNFQITTDNCSGRTLDRGQSCTIALSFTPQPEISYIANGIKDSFLELNTLQCTGTTTTDCEIDAGRFPVELKANFPSPLRMTPGAGLDFGFPLLAGDGILSGLEPVPIGETAGPMTIRLFNDPSDPNSAVVNFVGNRVQGDYFETDNCGASLAPGSSCILSVTFTPQSTGYDPGTITIGYTTGSSLSPLTQIIYLRGTGQ